MKIPRATAGLIFLFAEAAVFDFGGHAEEPELRQEISRLVREDARRMEEAGSKAPVHAPPNPTDAVQMSPFIVREYHRFYNLEALPENPVLRILRSGTILEHDFGKFASSLYFAGENVPGRFLEPTGVPRIELGVQLKW